MRFVFAILCGYALGVSFTARSATLAQFRTILGDIDVQLYDSDKPETVQNFIRYVNSGLYQDMFFHRWVPGFVIQGGGLYKHDRQSNLDWSYVPTFSAINNEYGVGRIFSNTYGTIAMARVKDQTNSATSQFFFNLANNSGLDAVDGGFTVFGRVVGGTNVLNRFNLTSPNNGIYVLPPPNDSVPVFSMSTNWEYIYVDISLLRVHVSKNVAGDTVVSWQSVSNRVNRVEFTTQMPPAWAELVSTNGTGQLMQAVAHPEPSSPNHFYRVRVDY